MKNMYICYKKYLLTIKKQYLKIHQNKVSKIFLFVASIVSFQKNFGVFTDISIPRLCSLLVYVESTRKTLKYLDLKAWK